MKITASGLSVVSGILTIPPTIAWYLDHTNVIHLPDNMDNWMLGIAVTLFVVAMISNAFVHRGMGKLIGQQPPNPVNESSLEQPATSEPRPFRDVNDFYRTYDNVLLRECEENVRKMAAEYPPNKQREDFLLRNIATLTVLGIFEMTWWNIFKSQLDALDALNKRNLTINELRSFYEEGKALHPKLYESRSFEAWLAFMRNYVLIIEEGETVKITVRGKEFLKYMVHCSYDPTQRVG